MSTPRPTTIPLHEGGAEHHVRILLPCLGRAYPYRTGFVLRGDGDCRPPRALTPVFFGCFDWHSAVHSHWALVRLVHRFPRARWSPRVLDALRGSFTAERLRGELDFQRDEAREGFEMPYGVAWFLALAAELREVAAGSGPIAPEAQRWHGRMEELALLFRSRFLRWIDRLRHPIRSGQHPQSAFALAMVLDAARVTNDDALAARVTTAARRLYLQDRAAPLAYEPSAYDFLSPCLGEADLLSRVLPPAEFARWLDGFLGELPRDDWPLPVVSTDPADGKFAHFQGLNLSRAWMMEGIAAALPRDDPRRDFLRASARAHSRAGLAAVTGEHYAGAHWLSSFAIHLLTTRRARRRHGEKGAC